MKKISQADLERLRANGAQVQVKRPNAVVQQPAVSLDLAPLENRVSDMAGELAALHEREAALSTRIVEELSKMSNRPAKVRAVVTERDQKGRIVSMEFEVIG